MAVWESEKTERKAEGGAAGSAAHHRAGAAAILYDCADFSEYFAVFSDRRDIADRRNRVFHAWRGACNVPDGRTGRHGDDTVQKAVGRCGAVFLLGFIITISEPDLQVLAQQVPAVPNLTLILAVACGVGVFLVVALLRMLFSIALPPLLVCFYAVIFILAFFVPKRIFERSVRFRRCDHGTDDGAVYYGAGRWYFCNAKRPPCSG